MRRRSTSAAGGRVAPWATTKTPPTRLMVHMAVPEGSRRSTSQLEWMRAVADHPAVALLRRDAAANVEAIAHHLALHADWTTLTARPGWSVLMARTGLSRSTVARWLAWLRGHGLLGIVEHGSTPEHRSGVLADPAVGNLASTYVLATPAPPADDEAGVDHGRAARGAAAGAVWVVDPETGELVDLAQERVSAAQLGAPDQSVDGNRTPPPPHERRSSRQVAHARPANNPPPLRGVARTPGATTAARSRPAAAWSPHTPARTKRERLALCAQLRSESSTLRAAGSAARLRSVLRPWLEAGWTVRGIQHALDHQPPGPGQANGAPWAFAWGSVADLRNPTGWAIHRMRAWVDDVGQPLPDPAATAAAAHQRQVEAQRARRAALAALQAEAAPASVVHQTLGAVRELLAARRQARRYPAGG